MDLCNAGHLEGLPRCICLFIQGFAGALTEAAKSGTCRPMKNSLGRDGIKELVKVVVSAKDDKVLGFHMVGSEASEIMQERC